MIFLSIYSLAVNAFLIVAAVLTIRSFNKKEEIINILKKQAENLKREWENKDVGSDDFSLLLSDLSCTITFVDAEQEGMKKLINKKIQAQLEDISPTGAKMSTTHDFPIRCRWKVKVEFTLNGENLSIPALIVRKEVYLKRKTNVYGLQFSSVSITDQKRIIQQMHRIEVEGRQKRIS